LRASNSCKNLLLNALMIAAQSLNSSPGFSLFRASFVR
jgi:hypothetical protein